MTKRIVDESLLRQVLDALETCDAAHPSDGGAQWYDSKAVDAAITALRSALDGDAVEPQGPTVPATAYDRLAALNESNAARIMELEAQIEGLKQPNADPQQEPVYLVWMKAHCAWMHTDKEGFDNTEPEYRWMLYTTPQPEQKVESVESELFKLAVQKGLITIHTELVSIPQLDPKTEVSWMEGHAKACDISNEAASATAPQPAQMVGTEVCQKPQLAPDRKPSAQKSEPSASDGLEDIESMFNACMHRHHCKGWKQQAQKAAQWIAVSDRLPAESDGEVLVRMRDGRCEIAWATYWHGESNGFSQWTFRDPAEDETPTHWMKITPVA